MLQHIGYRKGDDKPSKWILNQSVLSIYPFEEGNKFSQVPVKSFSAKDIKQMTITREDEITSKLFIKDRFEKVELLGSEQVLRKWVCEINNCKMDMRTSISRGNSKNFIDRNILVEKNKKLFLEIERLELNSEIVQIDSNTIEEKQIESNQVEEKKETVEN